MTPLPFFGAGIGTRCFSFVISFQFLRSQLTDICIRILTGTLSISLIHVHDLLLPITTILLKAGWSFLSRSTKIRCVKKLSQG
jgi:hypothetical protein